MTHAYRRHLEEIPATCTLGDFRSNARCNFRSSCQGCGWDKETIEQRAAIMEKSGLKKLYRLVVSNRGNT